MGSNGGNACTVVVDGMLEGLWQIEGDRPVVLELFCPLTRAERADLARELDRVHTLLAR